MAKLPLEQKIRQLVATYLSGRIDFNELQQRFVRETWNIDLPEGSLVTKIELRMAEYTSGHWTGDEFREILRWITQMVVADSSVLMPPVPYPTGTDAVGGFAPRRSDNREWWNNPAVQPVVGIPIPG